MTRSTTLVRVAPPTCIVGSTAARIETWRPVTPAPTGATPGSGVTTSRSANVLVTTDWFAPVSRSHGARTPLTTSSATREPIGLYDVFSFTGPCHEIV